MLHLLRMDHKTNNGSNRLSDVLKAVIPGREYRRVKDVSDFLLLAMAGEIKEVLFVVGVPENGYTPEWNDLIASLIDRPNILKGIKGAVLVDGEGAMFTKDIGRKLIFAANYAGCSFPGRPLVEATGDLYNFKTTASVKGVDSMTAYVESVAGLLDRLEAFEIRDFSIIADSSDMVSTNDTNLHSGNLDAKAIRKKKILAIHSSNKETSNSLMLLDMVKSNFDLKRVDLDIISIRNGDIVDCRGCGFEACKHFGETGECFYGGVMVEQVYPAILDCDALILVSPNYNDSVGANMMAMFNRLTALFYNNSFGSKELYSLIVSGYSGGDILAQQIIGTMNCNKGFILPGHFAMIETANDPGDISNVPGISERARKFALMIQG